MNGSARGTAPRFTIITGLSGAGRHESAKCLEDLGYFVIDNLPPALIEKMAELVSAPGNKVSDIALVVDPRGGEYFPDLQKALAQLSERGIEYRILFLEARDTVLARRFALTRRRHPMADHDRIVEGIAAEREVMQPLREQADIVVDTSDLNVHELREKMNSLFAQHEAGRAMTVNVISFGYKHGLPMDADLVLDCRFLPNPHWVEELRPRTGTDPAVRDYVLAAPESAPFLERVFALVDTMLPGLLREGRHYLTIAVGCTGGKHRSVVISEEVERHLAGRDLATTVTHRDLEKE